VVIHYFDVIFSSSVHIFFVRTAIVRICGELKKLSTIIPPRSIMPIKAGSP